MKKVKETKRDEAGKEGRGKKRGEERLHSRAIIYRYCKSRAGGDVSKTKMPNRSLRRERGFIHFYRHFSSRESGTLSQAVPPEHSSRAKCFLWSHF